MKMFSKLLAALVVSGTLFASSADALNLTGTWAGTQVCLGNSENFCPFFQQTENEEGQLEESNLYIVQDGTNVKAFSDFFAQSYNGVFVSGGADCNPCQTLSLVDCSANACDLANSDRIPEIVILQVIDENRIVGTSAVTGADVDGGLYTQFCTFNYRRVDNEIPCNIVECCCGLADETCPTLTCCKEDDHSCSESSSSSSSSSCSEHPVQVKRFAKRNR